MFYIVAEKILTGNEPLRTEWAVEGTTGYGFLNLVNGLFVDHTKEKAFQQLYRRFTGWTTAFDDLVCDSKRLILQVAMSSELNVLARRLDHISEQHRWSRDFTLESLRDALREVLAAFPVYRTYVRSDQDRSGRAGPASGERSPSGKPSCAIPPSANRCSISSKAFCCWSIPTASTMPSAPSGRCSPCGSSSSPRRSWPRAWRTPPSIATIRLHL